MFGVVCASAVLGIVAVVTACVSFPLMSDYASLLILAVVLCYV